MNFQFGELKFKIKNENISIEEFGKFKNKTNHGFLEIQVAGENKISHGGIKMINSSEGERLKYVSHNINGNVLSVIQESDLIRTNTVFNIYDDAAAVGIYTEVTNISDEDIVLEEVSAIVLNGLICEGSTKDLYYTRFLQSHHTECQPVCRSFKDYGFTNFAKQPVSQMKIAFANIGTWSTKEELPQGIIENAELQQFLMFQIESNSQWYYEISDRENDFYLYLGGANASYGSWSKKLAPDTSYRTVNVAIAFGSTLNEVIGEITKYRRHICGLSEVDKSLPAIFNEYMHLSWDSPSEENTKLYAPVVAKTNVEYYVIDCGWHNEEPGDLIYPYVGQWKESKVRFPNGVRATTDFIRSLGMKPGLWIEPEIVGINCKEMLDYYDDDCFLKRHGKRVTTFNRYFLDYRHPKVIEYMSETIKRMVEEYGADYIKFDYNQDAGCGTEYACTYHGEGLELAQNAFLEWVESMKKRFPDVVFEGCASGGMRMDYKSLSTFSLMSTSDQICYKKYPYIAGNILSAVIPEQAAVWSYPVGECTKNEISDNRIIVNMINSFLGRMHLASHLEWMNEAQLELVKQGVKFYKSLVAVKQKALPYLPLGFAGFENKIIASGLRHDKKIYLAVWNFSDEKCTHIKLDGNISNAIVAYPKTPNATLNVETDTLSIDFHSKDIATFLIIDMFD